MRALCWHGKKDIRCDTVPDPKIEEPRDVILKVTSCAICGSDLHLFDGFMPGMESGDIMGHEFMGEVVEVGRDTKRLKVGGIALLASDDPAPWLWARVAGDALDAATLTAAATNGSRQQAKHAVAAIVAVAPVVMMDVATALLAQSRDDARRNAARDYSDRSGFGKPAEQMRGAAADFAAPRDMRAPAPMRALEAAT